MSQFLNELDNLIPSYFLNKQELNNYDKICKAENTKIKQIMEKLTLQHYETDQYKATRTVSERTNMDEDILLSILAESDDLLKIATTAGIIKTKEYVDFDALENAIYKEMFNADQMLELNKAVTTKEVVTLKVSKIKKKKGED